MVGVIDGSIIIIVATMPLSYAAIDLRNLIKNDAILINRYVVIENESIAMINGCQHR